MYASRFIDSQVLQEIIVIYIFARVWATNYGQVFRQVVSCRLKFEKGQISANSTQHVATRWPNALNMLQPKMLRYVALTCCDLQNFRGVQCKFRQSEEYSEQSKFFFDPLIRCLLKPEYFVDIFTESFFTLFAYTFIIIDFVDNFENQVNVNVQPLLNLL